MRTRYPDRDFADEETMFGQIDDDYADYERRIGEYEARDKVVEEGMGRDPRAAHFFVQLVKGENPWTSLINMIGADGVRELMDDPAKQEEFAKANKEYVERLSEETSLKEEYRKNIAESMQMLDELSQERGLSDETVDAAMDLLAGIVDDAIRGRFRRENVEMALNALQRDADLENARAEGEIAGRNAKIEEQRRRSRQGDGMPGMGGASTAVPVPAKKGFLDDLPQRKF